MSDAVQPRNRGRSIGSLVLFVVATILLIPAVVGQWGNRTVIDTDRYIATVGPLIEQPAVQEALATAVTDQIVTRLDTESHVESLLGSLLPENASGISGLITGPIASGINGLIGDLVAKFVASDQFATIWVEFNRTAQRGAVAMLEGRDDGIVRLEGDEIVLDLSSALQAIQTHLVDSGITAAANIPLPETTTTIPIAEAPALAQVRSIYQVAGPVLSFLPILVAALYALSIYLARFRARTVVALGVVLVVSMVVLLLAINTGQEAITQQLALSPWSAAVDAFWWTLLDYLVAAAQGFIALGAVLIAAGWFGGRTSSARWARGHVTAGLADLSGRARPGKAALLPAGSLPWLRGAAYLLGLVILALTGTFSVGTTLWVGALVAGLVTVIQLLGNGGTAPAALPPAQAVPPAAPAPLAGPTP